jgi:hypothetical protein
LQSGRGEMVARSQAVAADTTVSAWARAHVVDIITLLLGTVLALRFWYLFFGVGDYRLMTILTAIAACEVAKRVVLACRRQDRPQLFCSDRRADLMAALALGTAPWPITIPIAAATPLMAIGRPLAQAGWVGPLAAIIVVGVALRRLFTA